MQKWIKAARLRTLPLSLASILMGNFLAAYFGSFSYPIFLFTVLTTVCLQVLSNYANDYGDTVNGADLAGRIGPARAVQSGDISKKQMLNAVLLFIALSLLSGIYLLYICFGTFNSTDFYSFMGLGILAILAAYFYTAGKKPYGYAGLGDISVFIFFGIIGVFGSYYLQTKLINWEVLLPAFTSGFFAVAVLNINNLRDIESDARAGKYTIPVRLGKGMGVQYHRWLLVLGWLFCLFFVFYNFKNVSQLIFIISLPIFIKIAHGIKKGTEPVIIDGFLKKMALGSLIFTLLFGLGLVIANISH